MYANEVKNLKWVSVSDWSELTMTEFGGWNKEYHIASLRNILFYTHKYGQKQN